MRSGDGFPENHTSADNLAFIEPSALADTFRKCLAVFDILEKNRLYWNQCPKCEPQLGKRGLYRATGGWVHHDRYEEAVRWVLNFSDGNHTLLDIARQASLPFDLIWKATDALCQCGLLQREGM